MPMLRKATKSSGRRSVIFWYSAMARSGWRVLK
jgi:hypothetical protein